jgi:hypothetical protein
MSATSAAQRAPKRTDTSSRSDTRLYGRWRVIARVGWLATVIGTLALFVSGLPAFYTDLAHQPCTSAITCILFGSQHPDQLHTLQAAGLSVSDISAYFVGLQIAIVVIWSAVGIVIFWRRSDDWLALLVALALILFNAGMQGGPVTALTIASPVWTLPVELLSFFGQASFGVLLFLFPNGRFAPRWSRWFALVYVVQTALAVFPPANSPLSVANVSALDGLLFVSAAIVAVYSQIYRYRGIASPVQRQQVKWAVFGIIVTIALVVLLDSTNAISGLSQSSIVYLAIQGLYPLALLLIPFSIGIAVLRFRLFDIDVIINRTLVYGSLTAILAAIYFMCVVGFQAVAEALTGVRSLPPPVIVISTLLVATLFTPLRRRLQSVIDRRFYRTKYDAQKTLAAFGATLRQEVDLSELQGHLLAIVTETMQPAHVSLWLRPQERRPEGKE